MARRLKNINIIHHSGFTPPIKTIQVIKHHQFKVLKTSVGGDAPKDVLKIYQYNHRMRKAKPNTWPTYIAKIGHKWYPNESITEQLITSIGRAIDVKVAESQLLNLEGVIRFCSKHFHTKYQILSHGAEILSQFIDETDVNWINQLEKDRDIKSFINITDVIEAIKQGYPKSYKEIHQDFIQMLLFDSFVGNNDRHYFNWGVVTSIKETGDQPYFSPIYDTARALWWNFSDQYIASLYQNKHRKENSLKKYVRSSLTKITIPGNANCNHFELIDFMKKEQLITPFHSDFWTQTDILRKSYIVIEEKFRNLMVKERRELIRETLALRLEEIQKSLDL